MTELTKNKIIKSFFNKNPETKFNKNEVLTVLKLAFPEMKIEEQLIEFYDNSILVCLSYKKLIWIYLAADINDKVKTIGGVKNIRVKYISWRYRFVLYKNDNKFLNITRFKGNNGYEVYKEVREFINKFLEKYQNTQKEEV